MLLQYRVVDDKREEMLDLVDEHDQVVGVESRENFKDEIFNPKGQYVRVVNCFIVNSEHKIWIPVRSPHKKSFPSSLDFSCGGYVQSGETYRQAMISEIKEENNIKVKSKELILLGKLTPRNDVISVFMEVYKFITDKEIDYNKDDFTNAEWLSKEELITKIENGFPTKKHLLPVLLKLQDQI